MKTTRFLIAGLLCSFFFASCEKEDAAGLSNLPSENQPSEIVPTDIPEGYFLATFSPQPVGAETRVPVSGLDGRVRSVRYVVYDKATGAFVKEKLILKPTDPIPTWPMAAVLDTLPTGNYVAVFLGNMEPEQFVQTNAPASTILTNYTTNRANARINLPNSEFGDNNEFYMSTVEFSDANPNPYILLERIISMYNLRRVFVDAQEALNSLVYNIVNQAYSRDILETQLRGILSTAITDALDLGTLGNTVYAVAGGLDNVVNLVLDAVINPLLDQLYPKLVAPLVNVVGQSLLLNSGQSDILGLLGGLLNPWNLANASNALVTINNFPKAMNFDLQVTESFTGENQFMYSFSETVGATNTQKEVHVKGFNGVFDVRKINVLTPGLISGVVVDQVVDGGLLLNGTFVDINDPTLASIATNRRFESDYSFLGLGLKSYALQTGSNPPISITLSLGDVANLDGILGGIPIVSTLLSTILTPLKSVEVALPLNVPVLGIDNLAIGGGWKAPVAY